MEEAEGRIFRDWKFADGASKALVDDSLWGDRGGPTSRKIGEADAVNVGCRNKLILHSQMYPLPYLDYRKLRRRNIQRIHIRCQSRIRFLRSIGPMYSIMSAVPIFCIPLRIQS